MTEEKTPPKAVQVEFGLSPPKPAEPPSVKAVDETVTPSKIKLDEKPGPALEINVGAAVPAEEQTLAEPTPAETMLASRPLDDPSVLLQQQLGLMSGISSTRAAQMAVNTDVALHNMNIRMRREIELARRQAMHEAQGGGKKGKKRR